MALQILADLDMLVCMRSTKTLHVVSCHAEGEVGDVIVGGVKPPPGKTLWDQRAWIASDETLRNFLLNEPRGGVFRHMNLLVPPTHPEADMAFIIMEPEDTPPMSGSNSMCVATVLLDTGIIEMTEPQSHMTLEAPGGLIHVRADCSNGKANRIHVQNVPSFVGDRGVKLDVPGVGKLTVDTAYGGDTFVVVNAEDLNIRFVPDEARQLAEIGVRITDAANKQLRFTHPENPDWTHFSFCLFAGPIQEVNGVLTASSAVAIQPGKIDRSPTGTSVSARMALLYEQGVMNVGDCFEAKSLIGSTFQGRILETVESSHLKALVTEISGRAWITGTHQHMLDPTDPWPQGYRLSDTWPKYCEPEIV